MGPDEPLRQIRHETIGRVINFNPMSDSTRGSDVHDL